MQRCLILTDNKEIVETVDNLQLTNIYTMLHVLMVISFLQAKSLNEAFDGVDLVKLGDIDCWSADDVFNY